MSKTEFRRRLKASGKSQGEVAAELGVSIRSVNRWATGGGTISVPMAAAIRAKFPKK